jgi:hypothetical protein
MLGLSKIGLNRRIGSKLAITSSSDAFKVALQAQSVL